MFRYTVLALLVLFSAPASLAVERSTDGDGEVLIFPIAYSDNDFGTLLKLRNTSDQAIVTRMVVRAGTDGQVTAAFNLFMSANDSWSAALFQTFPDLEFGLITADTTCTDAILASSPTSGLPFVSVGSTGQTWIEAYSLGALTDADALRLTQDPQADTNTCPGPVDAGEIDLLPVANPLSGDAQIISVIQGMSFSVPTTAFKDFGISNRNSTLSTEIPTLADATPPQAIIDGKTYLFSNGLQAVNALLTASSVQTPVQVQAVLAGKTNLFLTFPTRHLQTDPTEQPFIVNTDPDSDESGQQLQGFFFNPQGLKSGLDVLEDDFAAKCTPPLPPLTKFGPIASQSQMGLSFRTSAGSSNSLLQFNDSEPATVVALFPGCGFFLDSTVASETGFYELRFPGFQTVALNGKQFFGLPIIPVSLTTVANGTLVDASGQNVLSNYGWVNQLKIQR